MLTLDTTGSRTDGPWCRTPRPGGLGTDSRCCPRIRQSSRQAADLVTAHGDAAFATGSQQLGHLVELQAEVTIQTPVDAPRVAAQEFLAGDVDAPDQPAVPTDHFTADTFGEPAVVVGVPHAGIPVRAHDHWTLVSDGQHQVVQAEHPAVFGHEPTGHHRLGPCQHTGAFVVLTGPFVHGLSVVVDGAAHFVVDVFHDGGPCCQFVRPAEAHTGALTALVKLGVETPGISTGLQLGG